jgi:exodeoxyribonuclease VII large subunit
MSRGLLSLEEGFVFQVSELVAELRGALEEAFGDVGVEGEIASLHRSSPGHVYFDLKDESALLRSVIFRRNALELEVEPEEGMQVRVRGHVDVYPPRGVLQLIVESLEPAGPGALRVAFERLRARLENDGLFDAAHKRALPFFPLRIGLVTSRGGAALHDFLRQLRRRRAGVEVVLCDARVQGEGAWREVVRGLHLLDRDPTIEVIVLARGGGSIEDLWTFNREELVRAVFEAETPVVSAIGHEVDVVLTDLVADVRAATPTAAADLVVPDVLALGGRVVDLERRLFQRQQGRLRELGHRLEALRRGLVHPGERLRALARALEEADARLRRATAAAVEGRARHLAPLSGRLSRAARAVAERRVERLAALGGRLDALSPLGVLGRGYGIVRRATDGAILTSSAQAEAGDDVRIRLAEGGLLAEVRARLENP